jgi:tetratricopeptide (TPR) repeat protein
MPVFGPMYAAFGELLLGQYERALENVDQALAINPNIADLYLVQGLAHCALGDYQAAEAAYTRGIEVEPDYIALYALRAETHLRQKDLTAVNADARVVIQSDLAPMFAALMQAGLTGEWQCDQFFDFDYSTLAPVNPDDLTELDTLPPDNDTTPEQETDHE